MEKKQLGIIGLTGGIASGKSKVALYLSLRSGLAVIDADVVARKLFAEPGKVLDGLSVIVGRRFFLSSGQLNRRLFRQAIFDDHGLRQAVDCYTHPLILQEISQQIDALQKRGCRQIIVEVPLLFEAGWQDCFQSIVVVYASYCTSIARLVRRDLVTFAEANLAHNTQLSLQKKVLLADYVIDNSGSWCDTILQVDRLSQLIATKNT